MLFASRNSGKFMGRRVSSLTFPTGNERGFARAMPSREPAQAMCCSGRFSAKYLREARASGQNCISSRMRRVVPGCMGVPLRRPSSVRMR